MSVGSRILEYMDGIGMTQAHLSKKMGVTPAKLNLTLNGKRKMSIDEYAAICHALSVRLDKFVIPRPLKPSA